MPQLVAKLQKILLMRLYRTSFPLGGRGVSRFSAPTSIVSHWSVCSTEPWLPWPSRSPWGSHRFHMSYVEPDGSCQVRDCCSGQVLQKKDGEAEKMRQLQWWPRPYWGCSHQEAGKVDCAQGVSWGELTWEGHKGGPVHLPAVYCQT